MGTKEDIPMGSPSTLATRKLRFRDVLVGILLATIFSRIWPFLHHHKHHKDKPAPVEEWKDDIWPLYPVEPWDISTDFPYTRKMEYEVTEGTWLRLDVHPKSGEVVFDMLGDLYCLPSWNSNEGTQDARAILQGIPHDSDPHFSPSGDRLVFRSDAELGFDNIWIMPYTSCDEMSLRSPKTTNQEDRLVREGRSLAQRVTNETYHFVSDARFHPSGTKVIATKWYTSGRSIGAGEGWEYALPSLSSSADHRVKAGDGKKLVGRVLPRGWTTEEYGNQQVGPEMFVWSGTDTLIYAKNVADEPSGVFEYSKDIHKGIYAIFSHNIPSGDSKKLVSQNPGGASRPELSRDGKTLAFVRRVRDKETLVLLDLASGTLHHIWDGLTYDLSMISAPMGTYPSFAFTPGDEAIVIWSSGHIYSVPLSVNHRGQKVSGGTPKRIDFKAKIQKRLAETMRVETDLVALETADEQRVHAFRGLDVDESGERVVFEAAGLTYIQHVSRGTAKARRIPASDASASYYQPSFVPHAPNLILHARWSDTNFTTFELADLSSGKSYEVTGLPRGRYFSPTLCGCKGSGRRMAFVKTGGDLLTGNIVATAGTGLYLAELELPSSDSDSDSATTIEMKNIQFIPSDIDTSSPPKLKFLKDNTKLLVQQSDKAFTLSLSKADTKGKPDHTTLATGRMSQELRISGGGGKKGRGYVAFLDQMHVYLVRGKHAQRDKEKGVWSKPGNNTKGLARLSLDGGHDISWSRDGTKVFWLLGPYLHSLEISKLSQCRREIARDHLSYGIGCIKDLLEVTEIHVSYETDIARLKSEAGNVDTWVIRNATVIRMEAGELASDVVSQGSVVVKGGVIQKVGRDEDVNVPDAGATFNAQGGTVLPGFIDGHAHWGGFSVPHPAKSWEMETFLAYGVTTLHNPSSDNVDGFVERARVERGSIPGSRIFHTGAVVYGAGLPSHHMEAVNMADARSILTRIKAEGGPASFSYKNYNQPSRGARQRLILAARELGMISVPEGGMNWDWDLTYITDGMATVEHNLPVPKLYDDVLTFYAKSGTGVTPTHLVNYGGVMGEQLLWDRAALPFDSKLRRFTRHDILESLSETTSRPWTSFQLLNVSESVNELVNRGARAQVGAHGEPPLGSNYHGEMWLFQLGGMSNYKILESATRSAAITFGLDGSIGSLSPGKLADLVVYPPGVDLLEDLSLSSDPLLVSRGGRVWNAATMDMVWPAKTKRSAGPPLNPE